MSAVLFELHPAGVYPFHPGVASRLVSVALVVSREPALADGSLLHIEVWVGDISSSPNK